MSQIKLTQGTDANTADSAWKSLYKIGAAAAILALCGTLFDIILASMPGWQASTVPTSVAQWYEQLQTNPLLGLRNLDLLNIIIAVVGLPMYVALYGVHRKTRAGITLLALVFVAVGTAVFVGSNVALPMLELSRQYGLASTESQRLIVQGSGVALLAQGSHGSMGVFAGFLLPSLGTLLMAVAMLGGGVFPRIDGIIGIIGTSLLLAYVVGSTFSSVGLGALMVVAGVGGVLMMVWNVRVARVLFRLGASG